MAFLSNPDGKEIMNVADVSSDLFGQHQQSVSVAVEEGQVTIDVSIPTRGLSDSRNLLINKDMFVGISIVKPDLSHSGIRFIFSSELLSEY